MEPAKDSWHDIQIYIYYLYVTIWVCRPDVHIATYVEIS